MRHPVPRIAGPAPPPARPGAAVQARQERGGARDEILRLRTAMVEAIGAKTKAEADAVLLAAMKGLKGVSARRCPHENVTSLVDGPVECDDCGQTWLTREDFRRGS